MKSATANDDPKHAHAASCIHSWPLCKPYAVDRQSSSTGMRTSDNRHHPCLLSIRRQSPMRREACLGCRTRKLRCDVTTKLGAACSRCIEEGRESECVVPPRQKRRIQRRSKTQQPQGNIPAQPEFPNALTSTSGDYIYDSAGINADSNAPISSAIPGRHGMEISNDFNDTFDYNDSVALDSIANYDAPTSGLQPENNDNILQHVCEQIAMPHSRSRIASPGKQSWVAFIEYQNPLHAAGILGELEAGYSHANRIIQINSISPNAQSRTPSSRRQLELHGLDEHEIAFLTAKHAFSLPSRGVCKEFFTNFFTFAYPYAPILDRCSFLVQYDRQDYSSFVLQALLANAVSYASHDLIKRAGFSSHQDALRAFHKRAVLLYDFNCEKDQLSLLQGSLLLGLQWISHVNDKDYRFWMATAIRLAMRMGLHRKHIEEELDSNFYQLLKRIWAVIWVRDVLLVTTGLENGRRVSDDCDTIELVESDWYEAASNVVPEDLRSCLPITNTTQKQFFIHLSRLALVGREAHAIVLSRPLSQIDHSKADTVLQSITSWRRALPFRLMPESVSSWTSEGLWVLVLATWCCRIESHIHRTLWRSLMEEGALPVPISRGLQNAVFNLDAIIKRAILHGLCRHMPLSISTSAAVNGALAIELLCQPSISPGAKLVYEEAVRNSVQFLTQTQEIWTTVRALLRLFAWVTARKGLRFHSGLEDMEWSEVNHGEPSSTFLPNMQQTMPLQGDETVNPLLFSMDTFMDWQNWNDIAMLRTL